MKPFISFALLIVGITALPQQLSTGVALSNERFVTDSIASTIEDISQQIVDAGLDPLYIQHQKDSVGLPVPVLFNAEGLIEEFLCVGLSDIVINRLTFNALTQRLRLDISLPLIEVTLKKAEVDVTFFGKVYNAAAAGRFAIKNINVHGDVRVSVGIISGISVRSIDLNLKLGNIHSALAVTVANHNMSYALNTFFGITIPNTLNDFEDEINELLEIVVTEIINENL